MTQQTISLIDILSPPVNQWLKELSLQKVNLPVGVRVVRFNNGDDDGPDASGGAAVKTAGRPQQ